jgi:predicted RNA binding protein YcfA (HicA-like mRNA interferase family)
MGKLKRLSGEEIIKVLKRLGFEPVRQRGSHVVLKKTTIDGAVGCVVPMIPMQNTFNPGWSN